MNGGPSSGLSAHARLPEGTGFKEDVVNGIKNCCSVQSLFFHFFSPRDNFSESGLGWQPNRNDRTVKVKLKLWEGV